MKRSYRTSYEPGENCLFSIRDEAGQVSVGVVLDVLRLLRLWMVPEKRLGSAILNIFVNEVRVATGEVRPIVNQPPTISEA